MMSPAKIAQMMTDMNYGGVEMIIMNYYRHIDRNQYQFDFYALEGSEIPQRKEIESLGGRIFIVPRYTHPVQYEKALIRHFKKEKYPIVHSNMNALSIFSLFAAKKAGVPNRIAHNHSTCCKGETKKSIVKYMLRPFSRLYPTMLIACSKLAGDWLYGKKAPFTVCNNAIELQRFTYNPNIRDRMRHELGIADKFVIGHVGRFCYQKNHALLIDIFSEIKKKKADAFLLLVGEGELERAIQAKIRRVGLEDSVLWLARRNDVSRIYQAMDVFVLPSRYEGLPVVGVEAQASGLACVFSDKVPQEAKVLSSTVFVPISAPVENWADTVINRIGKYERKDTTEEMRKAGFDIEEQAKRMMLIYDDMIAGRKQP